MTLTEVTKKTTLHPLDPLSAEEIDAVSSIFRKDRQYIPTVRFVSIERQEPTKEELRAHEEGSDIERRAFVVLRDPKSSQTIEVVVSLTDRRVISLNEIPNAQPGLTDEDAENVEQLVRQDPRWQEALRKRGVTNFEHVMLEPWPCAYLTEEDAPSRRLNRPLTYVRHSEDENGYAHPVDNLTVLVDLDRQEVLEVVDHGVVDIPKHPGDFTVEGMKNPENFPHFEEPRTDLKPLEITQPDGASFEVNGYEVQWQKWQFRVGFTPREGLVLHTIDYNDRGTLRSVAHRISLSEMVVPYADTAPTQVRKNVFDGGEDGLGKNANSLTLGCDCLGSIYYFDVALSDNDGNGRTVENGICMHEEDYGVLWKHTDLRTGKGVVRRSRRLVVSQFMTLANYDYGFFWYFYQDGSIECEVKLTGIMAMGSYAEGETPRHGAKIAPGLYAPHHQHFFSARLDMAVDGPRNTVFEVDSVPVPPGPDNPYGNAWTAESTPLVRESEAKRDMDLHRGRYWKVLNEEKLNHVGDPVGYKLQPGENVFNMYQKDAPAFKRAGFTAHHMWVTQYDADERFAAGDYPYQSPGGEGLPKWVQQDRALRNEDVVMWYTFGAHHTTRPEDWPIMPVHYIGFHLKPLGFFDGNPGLDVPESTPASQGGSSCHA